MQLIKNNKSKAIILFYFFLSLSINPLYTKTLNTSTTIPVNDYQFMIESASDIRNLVDICETDVPLVIRRNNIGTINEGNKNVGHGTASIEGNFDFLSAYQTEYGYDNLWYLLNSAGNWAIFLYENEFNFLTGLTRNIFFQSSLQNYILQKNDTPTSATVCRSLVARQENYFNYTPLAYINTLLKISTSGSFQQQEKQTLLFVPTETKLFYITRNSDQEFFVFYVKDFPSLLGSSKQTIKNIEVYYIMDYQGLKDKTSTVTINDANTKFTGYADLTIDGNNFNIDDLRIEDISFIEL